MYDQLTYGQAELAEAMRTAYDEIINFVTKPEFKAVMRELGGLSSADRPGFVLSVLLNKRERERRGIHLPDGIVIQRSAFGDRRPTLFCVKKYLPTEFSDVWQNVNITFDDAFEDNSVSRKPEIAWRQPLPIPLQAEVMAKGGDLEGIDV